jgi:hypothetical protein
MNTLWVIIYATLMGAGETGEQPQAIDTGYATSFGSNVFLSREECEAALLGRFLKDDWKATRGTSGDQLIVYISNSFVKTSYGCVSVPVIK